jgi:ABC-type nickel/cobalt efflux system permease component RcnA
MLAVICYALIAVVYFGFGLSYFDHSKVNGILAFTLVLLYGILAFSHYVEEMRGHVNSSRASAHDAHSSHNSVCPTEHEQKCEKKEPAKKCEKKEPTKKCTQCAQPAATKPCVKRRQQSH